MLLRLPVYSRIRRGLMWRAVRLGYEVYNATGQINVHILTPDAVLIQPCSELGNEGVFHGRKGFVRGGHELQEIFGDFRVQPEELIDPGDRLLVFVRLRGRARMSGIPLNQPMTHVYSYRGRQVAELHVYPDPEVPARVGGTARRSTRCSSLTNGRYTDRGCECLGLRTTRSGIAPDTGRSR
jgi:ketosteroid isomerase-like protein